MKLLRRIGENLPAILFFVLAVVSAVIGDYGNTRFSVIMIVLFFILKDLYEIKAMIKKKE